MKKKKNSELVLEYAGMGPKKRKEKMALFLCTHRKATIKI